MKKRITIMLLVAVLLSALLVAPAFSQKLGYKEPDNRPSYVQHWFERVTTTCPSCGQSVTYNSTPHIVKWKSLIPKDFIIPWQWEFQQKSRSYRHFRIKCV